MTGTLAQIIALTAFGNDFLKNGTLPTDFNTANTTFQFCNKVDFREFKNLLFFLNPINSIDINKDTKSFDQSLTS